MYSWIVKRSLYFPTDKYQYEIILIGNTKLMGLIPSRLLSVLVCKRYTTHLIPSCCGGSDFSPANHPQPVQAPSYVPPTLLGD